jgi:glycosyltransferase involved in cell wall biosynthesis
VARPLRVEYGAAVRIVHLISYPLYSGPVPPTVGLAAAQRQQGHQVWLAVDAKRGAFNEFEEAAVPRVKPLGLEPPAGLTLSTKSTPLEVLRDLSTLRRSLTGGGVDVVHAHMSHDHCLAALVLPRRGAAVLVRTVHAERSLAPRLGQGWLNRRAHGWITRCDEHRARLVRGFRVPSEQVAVIPGSIDADTFVPASPAQRAAARSRFALPAGAPVIAHVALIADRGQAQLVRAVARLGDAAPYVLFVGRGEGENGLRQLVSSLGLQHRVRFAGYLQGPHLLDGYAAADAAFVAQPGNDASTRAALEGLAAGLPVVAVQRGAIAELVDSGVGYRVPAAEPAAIATAIAEWLADREQGRRRGLAGRRRMLAERSFSQEARKTLAWYERAVSIGTYPA